MKVLASLRTKKKLPHFFRLDLPKPKAIIFDCDGVLIDSRESTRVFFNGIRARVGLPKLSVEEEEVVFARTTEAGLKYIIPESRLDAAIRAKNKYDLRSLLPLIHPEPGIKDLLRFLNRSGIQAAVDTNGGQENIMILEHLGMDGFFDLVVTAEDVRRPKPDPEGAEYILNSLDLDPREAVFIGDTSTDGQTARSAGLTFLAYKNTGLTADYHVDSFPGLLEQLNLLINQAA